MTNVVKEKAGQNQLGTSYTHMEALNHFLDKAQTALRKWSSNSIDLKTKIPGGLLENDEVQLICAPSSCHKALGVYWNTANGICFK